MRSPRILIADSESYDTLAEIPYVFHAAGCEVDVLCDGDAWLRRNLFHRRHLSIQNSERYANQIIKLWQSGVYDHVVLGDDRTIDAVFRAIGNDTALAQALLPIKRTEYYPILGSKLAFIDACTSEQLPTPETHCCAPGSDRQWIASHSFSYPVIIKPDQGHSGTGISKCDDAAELSRAIGSFSENEGFMIQHYVEGDITNVEALYKSGILLGYAYSITRATTGSAFGVSAVREYKPCLEIESLLLRIGMSFGINGFVNMTFMFDVATRQHLLIEADMRPQAWVSLARFAGVDFSAAIRRFISADADTQPIIKNSGEPSIVRHFARDCIRCIIAGDRRGLREWFTNKDGRWRFIPWYDPLLSAWMVGRVLKFWIKF